MNKIKSMLLQFAKPLLLQHLSKLDMLEAPLAKKMVEKSHMSQEEADALSKALVDVIQTELAVLINKI